LKQVTLFEKGILQSQQSKICEITTKKMLDYVQYWKKIHQDTNWNEVSYDLKSGKKSNGQLSFRLVGTGESKEYCGEFVTEGCSNHLEHPKEMVYVQNKRLTCKRSECPICWDSWLVREASRVTERIEKFRILSQKHGFRASKPIHVIVSPPKWLWNITWTELKKYFRKMVKRAGIVGGVSMFHAFRKSSDGKTWFYSPHFHMIGYGWVINTKKISSNDGWVIKNKSVRKSSSEVYSTSAYLLSHTAIAKGVHSVTWFGDLSYRSKYALELKRETEEGESDKCPYCSQYLVLFEIKAGDRPPPDKEWFGLVERYEAYPVETNKEMLERKFWLKKKIHEENSSAEAYWNLECQKAWEKADQFRKQLEDTASTDTASTEENSVSPTLQGKGFGEGNVPQQLKILENS